MDSITALIAASFVGLPAYPPISLRGGNALDDYETLPAFDPVIDKVTPEYPLTQSSLTRDLNAA